MNQKLINFGAMLLVGDGLLHAVCPTIETRLWQGGPKVYRALVEKAAAHPNLTRGVALLELGLGLWLVSRQWKRPKASAGHTQAVKEFDVAAKI